MTKRVMAHPALPYYYIVRIPRFFLSQRRTFVRRISPISREREKERIASGLDFSSESRSPFGHSCVRRAVTFTSNAAVYSHVAFALDITEGIARSSGGRVVIQGKKIVRGGGRKRETNDFIVTPSLRFVRKRS